MLKAINNIVVALISKTTHPKSFEDFIPIACCFTIYKIISKVISGRIKGVLEDMLDMDKCSYQVERSQIILY